jgi:hypothetical protein
MAYQAIQQSNPSVNIIGFIQWSQTQKTACATLHRRLFASFNGFP